MVASGCSLAPLLADAIKNSPIRQEYELLVARADVRANRIKLDSHPLFTIGARRGDATEVTVRCEWTGDHGVILAVIARERDTPRLLWAGSVPLQPGRYRVRVELLGPGIVRFIEPAGVASDNRNLKELMDELPRTLNSVKKARIICAVELSGPPKRVAARLYRAEKIIKKLDQQLPEPGQLQVGIVGYGAHRSARKDQDDRVIVSKWMAPPSEALISLGWLGAANFDYPYAAQIEDMLAEVVRRLDSIRESRLTALFVLGDRPPYPSNDNAGFLGCPNAHDWQKSLSILKQRSGIAIIAIRDDLAAAGTVAWASLGSTALLSLDRVDEYELGRRIGLIAPSLQNIPFPMVDSDEGGITKVTAASDRPAS